MQEKESIKCLIVSLMIPVTQSFQHKETGQHNVSFTLRKTAFCICENKDTDQLHGNREADQCLCFHYIDRTIPLLSKYEISSHLVWLNNLVCVGPGQKPRRPVF